jgi:hypothetical protein
VGDYCDVDDEDGGLDMSQNNNMTAKFRSIPSKQIMKNLN